MFKVVYMPLTNVLCSRLFSDNNHQLLEAVVFCRLQDNPIYLDKIVCTKIMIWKDFPISCMIKYDMLSWI